MADQTFRPGMRTVSPHPIVGDELSAGKSRLSRRLLLTGAVSMAAGCNSNEPRRGLLGLADRLNEKTQSGLFRPRHRAVELTRDEESAGEDFPIYFISETVPRAPAGWQLKVSGMVRQAAYLGLDDLRRMSRADVRVRHYCVEGWSAVASWHGVRLRDIAERVGADPRASFVEFRSFDAGYWSSWDRDSAFHEQTILAYGMNGHDLSAARGAPLRLYSPIKLGYKQVKYLSELSFLPHQTAGYWEDRGYEWFAGV